MSSDIRSALRNWLPPWIQPGFNKRADEGFRLLYSLAAIVDGTIEAMLQAVQSGYPEYCDPSALPRISRNRQILRGFAEPADVFAQRALRWLDDHKRQGNPYTLLEQLRAYFYPYTPRLALVNGNGTWYEIGVDGSRTRTTSSPPNWDWDGQNVPLPHRCWIIVYAWSAPGLVAADGTWGDGETWGAKSDSTWGCTFTREQVQSIQLLIDGWRSATALYVNVIVSFDDGASDFEPVNGNSNPGTWGHWSKNVAGLQTRARRSLVAYLDAIA